VTGAREREARAEADVFGNGGSAGPSYAASNSWRYISRESKVSGGRQAREAMVDAKARACVLVTSGTAPRRRSGRSGQ
jgi:hypothetical protein